MIAAIANYEFIQNAFLVGLILGVIFPFVGLIVLLRRIPFIADTLGHVNISGIVFIYLINSIIALNFFSNSILIIIWTVLGSIFIEILSQKYTHYKEVSVMVVYAIAVSLTIIFLNLANGFNSNLYNIFFGSINTITRLDLYIVFLLATLILFIIYKNYNKILIISIDDELSKLYNVNLTFQRYLTIIIISITITMSIKILGVLLVSSLILIPNLAAIRLTNSLKQSLLLSIMITEFSFVFGFILAYFLNLSPSAIIVLIAVVIYFLSFLKKN